VSAPRSSPPAARRPVDLDAGLAGERVEVTTPEGVPIRFLASTAGDRLAAFLLDLLWMSLVLLVLGLLAALALGAGGNGWLEAFVVLSAFLVRMLYFTGFELRWQGRTPGKRRLGLRVVDAAGGPLTAEALIVRNLTREAETFLPLTLLLAGEVLWPGIPGGLRVVAAAWALLFGLLPLFHPRRLRLGDLVAGTMVVRAPPAVLLEDLGARPAGRGREAVPAPTFAFTDAQLDAYGIYELQVLEDVLRRARTARDPRALSVVAGRIRAKIRWSGESNVPAEPFLRDFYAALRARLEARLLLGKRKEDKHSR
jgi:uncharacterized RDD family membrane protein YckC